MKLTAHTQTELTADNPLRYRMKLAEHTQTELTADNSSRYCMKLAEHTRHDLTAGVPWRQNFWKILAAESPL